MATICRSSENIASAAAVIANVHFRLSRGPVCMPPDSRAAPASSLGRAPAFTPGFTPMGYWGHDGGRAGERCAGGPFGARHRAGDGTAVARRRQGGAGANAAHRGAGRAWEVGP